MPVHLKSSFNASLRHNNDEGLERFRQKMACEVKKYFIVTDDWRTFNKSQKHNNFTICPCHYLSSQLLGQ